MRDSEVFGKLLLKHWLPISFLISLPFCIPAILSFDFILAFLIFTGIFGMLQYVVGLSIQSESVDFPHNYFCERKLIFSEKLLLRATKDVPLSILLDAIYYAWCIYAFIASIIALLFFFLIFVFFWMLWTGNDEFSQNLFRIFF